jgi:uncharacterized OB-fold protein
MIHDSFPLPDVAWPVGAGFWEGAAEGELRIPRCTACETWVWYPKPECPACGGTEMPWTATSGRATLYSWAVVRHVFLPAFADVVPYVTALAALDDDPAVRIATRVLADPDELRAGMALGVVFRPLRFSTVEGEVTAPMFEPA